MVKKPFQSFSIVVNGQKRELADVFTAAKKCDRIFDAWYKEGESELTIESDVESWKVESLIDVVEGRSVGRRDGLVEFGIEWGCRELVLSQVSSGMGSHLEAVETLQSMGEEASEVEAKCVDLIVGGEQAMEFGKAGFETVLRVVQKAVCRGLDGSRHCQAVVAGFEVFGYLGGVLGEGMAWGDVGERELELLSKVGGSTGEIASSIMTRERAIRERWVKRQMSKCAIVPESTMIYIESRHDIEERERQERERQERERQERDAIRKTCLSSPFDGVFAEMQKQTGGKSAHDAKLIEVRVSSTYEGDPTQVTTDSKQNGWYSKNTAGSWIEFDFRSQQITLEGYAIDNYRGNSTSVLKSWEIRGSNNGIDWTVLDRRIDDETLKGQNKKSGFVVSSKDESFRIIRLVQIASHASNSHLTLRRFELFGKMNPIPTKLP